MIFFFTALNERMNQIHRVRIHFTTRNEQKNRNMKKKNCKPFFYGRIKFDLKKNVMMKFYVKHQIAGTCI